MTREPLPDHRRALARGYARECMAAAQADSADAARLMTELHDLAPNAQSRQRFAKRLGRRPGVVRAAATNYGIALTFRRHLDVTLNRDGTTLFREERIAWTRVEAVAGRGEIVFLTQELHVSFHAIQRHLERSAAPMRGLLAHLDVEMSRLARHIKTSEPILDRDDEFLPSADGMWAGEREFLADDPAWGAAFAHAGAQQPLFSIRTYLGEAELRPVVWLAWSRIRGDMGNGNRSSLPDTLIPATRAA